MTTSAICSCNSLPSAREHFRNVLIHDFHGRNAILMLVGLSIVFTASVLMVLITRRTVWDFLIATSLVLVTGIGCVLVWATAQGHYVNLTSSWPQ